MFEDDYGTYSSYYIYIMDGTKGYSDYAPWYEHELGQDNATDQLNQIDGFLQLAIL